MNKFWLLFLIPFFVISCIGDDIIFDTVEEQLRLTMMADSIAVGDSFQAENSTSMFANNSEHLTFGPEIAYNINDCWGVSAGFGTALSGKLIYAATSYNVGVFFKLKPKEKKASRYGM